jgi:site-specific recombinase XerD
MSRRRYSQDPQQKSKPRGSDVPMIQDFLAQLLTELRVINYEQTVKPSHVNPELAEEMAHWFRKRGTHITARAEIRGDKEMTREQFQKAAAFYRAYRHGENQVQIEHLGTLIVEYLRFIRGAAGYSKSTFKSYQSQLRRFDRWLSEQVERPARLADVSALHFREYILELSEGGRRPRTVLSAALPIRSLMNYLVETKQLKASPIHSVRLPKKDSAQRPQVTDEELLTLLGGCDRMAGTERPVMTKALLQTLATTGVRRSELLGLKVDDFRRDKGQLLITHGKGARCRGIFLTEETQAALEAWLELRPKCNHDYLFIVDTNRRLGHLGLHPLLNEVKAAAGLKDHDNIQPHAIRHAAASRMQQRGADLKSIQTMLGHTNITTTAIYLHTDEEHLRSVVHLASLRPDGLSIGKGEAESAPHPEVRPEGPQPSSARPLETKRDTARPTRYQRIANRPAEETRSPPGEEHDARCGSGSKRAAERPKAQPRQVPWALQRRRRP